AGFDQFLNQPSDLLAGAIQAFAAGASAPASQLLPRDMRRRLAADLEKISAGGDGLDGLIDDILRRVRIEKEDVRTGMLEGREKTLAELSSRFRPDELRARSFGSFFEASALQWTEDFVAGAERIFGPVGLVDACRARG